MTKYYYSDSGSIWYTSGRYVLFSFEGHTKESMHNLHEITNDFYIMILEELRRSNLRQSITLSYHNKVLTMQITRKHRYAVFLDHNIVIKAITKTVDSNFEVSYRDIEVVHIDYVNYTLKSIMKHLTL